MELAYIAFLKIIVMFLIMIIGVVCYKSGLISKEGNKSLSNILLLVVNPCVLFMAFQREFSREIFHKFLISVLFTVIVHIIAIVLANIFIRKNNEDFDVERLAAIYSNCGFIGIPMITALFGSEGVFYLSTYIIAFNILLWTHGVMTMTRRCDKGLIIDTLKNPVIIAVILGFICFIARVTVPKPMSETMNFMADLNTPLAMIIAGVTIAQDKVLPALKNVRVYFISALRLVIMPIIGAFVLALFKQDFMVTMIITVAFACPTAASGTLFAIRYNRNAVYASQIYMVSTVFSVLTVPAVIMLAQKIIEILG